MCDFLPRIFIVEIRVLLFCVASAAALPGRLAVAAVPTVFGSRAVAGLALDVNEVHRRSQTPDPAESTGFSEDRYVASNAAFDPMRKLRR